MDNTTENIVDSKQIALADRERNITTDRIKKSEDFILGLVKNKQKEEKTEDEREI